MRDSARKNIITSVPATCIAEFATLPICTLKTTYQNTDNTTIRGSFRSIYNNYGIKGFYNASVWAISSQVISTATKYTLYRKLEHSVPNKFMAGGIAGLIGSMMTHPFDVLKIHFQMHSSFISALKQEGPKLFYRGYSKSLTKAVVGSMLFLPLFDILNMRFQTDPHVNSSYKTCMAAMTSAVISTTIMHPIDYMKTRHIFGKTYQHYGSFLNFQPYFRGLSLNLIRVVPHFAITMISIDVIKHYL